MCNVVDSIQTMADDQLSCIATAPVQVGYGLLLASISLLRILKGTFITSTNQDLEFNRARSSLFQAINLSKQMSVASTDTPAKLVGVLNQLWHSRKAFRNPGGSDSTGLRIRSRLVHSVLVDTVWWWREEFDPHTRDMVVRGDRPSGLFPLVRTTLFHSSG